MNYGDAPAGATFVPINVRVVRQYKHRTLIEVFVGNSGSFTDDLLGLRYFKNGTVRFLVPKAAVQVAGGVS